MAAEPGLLELVFPRNRPTQREYIAAVVFGEFLHLPFEIRYDDVDEVIVRCAGYPGHIEMPDILFSLSDDAWPSLHCLPVEPLPTMPLDARHAQAKNGTTSLPALYAGEDVGHGIRHENERLRIPIDILGSCFFMLTRLEEIVAEPACIDAHGRFPAEHSLLSRTGLLDRPIIDEYLQLLTDALNEISPGLVELQSCYQPLLTHDVDHPVSTYGQASYIMLRRAAGDIVRRKNPRIALRRIGAYLQRDASRDPNNTFDWLMTQSERLGLKSRFHFMAATKSRFDSGYDIGAPFLAKLLKDVADRGHEIGIHPSYHTSDDHSLFRTEVGRLERALESAGVDDWSRTSRQHYLRWNAATTWGCLDGAGITTDSSVGFADGPGFRCGTSRSFTTYSWTLQRPLRIKEQPLIVMDVSLTGRGYLGLSWDQALEHCVSLASRCKQHGAPFTLLWHNDKVLTPAERSQYSEILEGITG